MAKLIQNFKIVKYLKIDLPVVFLTALIDFVSVINENHYPQVFLGECKHFVKKRNVIRHLYLHIFHMSDNNFF